MEACQPHVLQLLLYKCLGDIKTDIGGDIKAVVEVMEERVEQRNIVVADTAVVKDTLLTGRLRRRRLFGISICGVIIILSIYLFTLCLSPSDEGMVEI